MVSYELVSKEVARLGGLDRFPRKPEALKELALAFQRTYDTEPELAAAISDTLHTVDECPKPSHIYGVARGEPKASGVGYIVDVNFYSTDKAEGEIEKFRMHVEDYYSDSE